MPATVSHAFSSPQSNWTTIATIPSSTGGTVTAQGSDMVNASDWNTNHSLDNLSVLGSEIYSCGQYEPFIPPNTNSTLSTVPAGSWFLDAFDTPHQLGSGQINLFCADALGFKNGTSIAPGIGTLTNYQTLNTQLCLYRVDQGINSTQLASVWSNQVSFLITQSIAVARSTTNASSLTITNAITVSFPAQYDASGGVTYSTTAQSGTHSTSGSSAASSFADSFITGALAYLTGSKVIPVPFATELSAGDYYMAIMISSSSSSTASSAGSANFAGYTLASTQSILGALEFVDQAYKVVGASVSNSSTCLLPFEGVLASTLSAPPLNIQTSDIRNLVTPRHLVWNYCQSSY